MIDIRIMVECLIVEFRVSDGSVICHITFSCCEDERLEEKKSVCKRYVRGYFRTWMLQQKRLHGAYFLYFLLSKERSDGEGIWRRKNGWPGCLAIT